MKQKKLSKSLKMDLKKKNTKTPQQQIKNKTKVKLVVKKEWHVLIMLNYSMCM